VVDEKRERNQLVFTPFFPFFGAGGRESCTAVPVRSFVIGRISGTVPPRTIRNSQKDSVKGV
jgi:hypothetical protein